MYNRKFIAALVSALIFGIAISFAARIFITNIKKEQDNIITNNLGSVEAALKLNINFLSARRAEKNMLLYKDMKYKEQVGSWMQEASLDILKLKALSLNSKDAYNLVPLENNLINYNNLFEDLVMAMSSKTPNPEDIKSISDKIKELNDIFSDNIEFLINKHSKQIEEKRAILNTYFTVSKNVLTIIFPVIIVFGYIIGHIIFFYDVV